MQSQGVFFPDNERDPDASITQFSAGLTPDERDYIPERDFLKEKLHAHDLYFDLKTEEEVQKIRDERSKSASAQLAMAMAQAEIEYKKAQTLAQTTRARKLNVDAIKAAAEPPEVPQGTSKELQDAEVSLANEKTRGQSLKNTEEELKTRRAEEKHAQEMSHSEDNHALDQAERELRVSEDLSAKREMQKATIEAKKTAAKQRKVGGMKPKKDQNR